MDDGPAGQAVRASLVAIKATPGSARDRALLRARVCEAVDELRAAGWPVERIIVRVKQVAGEVGLGMEARRGQPTPSIIDEIVSWCIERYYEQKQ